jgi:hypothetical protein
MDSYKHGRRGQFLKGHTVAKFEKEPIFGNFAPKSRWGMVPTNKLIVDQYQRKVSHAWASKVAHNWDQAKAGAFKVSLRKNGFYAVIDGQGRHYALRLMENPPAEVFAEIFENLTYEQEADLFAAQAIRRNLTSGDIFHSSVEAKHTNALQIVSAAHKAGFTAEYKSGPKLNNLRAYATVTEIHRRRGESGLTRILKICAKAWPDDIDQTRAPILLGLEAFLAEYSKVNDEHLVVALSKTKPRIIMSDAYAMNKTFSSAVQSLTSRIILTLYNRGMKKNRLSAN